MGNRKTTQKSYRDFAWKKVFLMQREQHIATPLVHIPVRKLVYTESDRNGEEVMTFDTIYMRVTSDP